MEPNNLDNTQPIGPQPMGEPQPIQPMGQSQPIQPMGQPQPIQPEQPMVNPLQPDTQLTGMSEKPKSKTNLIIIAIIAGVAVLLTIIGIVIALNVGGKKSEPAEPIPEPEAENIVPTPELAEAVCEKYNGTLIVSEGEEVADDYDEIESRYTCQRYENAQQEGGGQAVVSYTANDFMYQVDFIKEDKVDERWTRMKSAVAKSENEILENSDEVIKVHNSMSGPSGEDMETDMVIYKEATVALMTFSENNPLVEEILKELGFVEDDNSGKEDPDISITPTPELAESVCKKNSGKLDYSEGRAILDSNENFEGIFSSMYTCEKNDDFSYEIYFADDDKLEDFWLKAKASMEEDEAEGDFSLGEYTILENSDDYIKFYVTISAEGSSAFLYTAVYKNAMVMVTTTSNAAGEEILAELGFPSQKQID